jgi:hypothetical protein
MVATVDLYTIFIHTKFHIPSSSESLLTAVKLKPKLKFLHAHVLH